MKRILRLLAVNAAVFALLLVAGLAAIEAWLRLTVPSSSEESIFEYTLKTQRYKVMRANASVLAYGEELRTNELGFRDRQSAVPAKRPGEFRIVVLGDSFTVSAGVGYERIFTTLIEKSLRRRHPEVKVINLGVAGYNIVQYELVLKEVALGLEPDLVLVAVFPTNDFMNDTLEGNRKRAFGAPPPAGPVGFHKLYVYQAYLGRAEAKAKSLLAQALARAKGGPGVPDPMVEAWDENVAALARIADTLRQRRIPLQVTALPHTFHFEKQRPLERRLFAFCARQGIPTYDLLEDFIASGVSESSLRLNPLDSHPNAAYNALVARYLGAHLEGLLVRSAQPLAAVPSVRTGYFPSP